MGGGPKYYMLIQQYTAKTQYVYLSTYCFKFKVNTLTHDMVKSGFTVGLNPVTFGSP